jgi:hypothetical protein
VGRLREEHGVQRVGEERDGRRVGGDLPPEQVSDGDIRHASRFQRLYVAVYRLCAVSHMKTTLDRVDQHDLPCSERSFDLPIAVRYHGQVRLLGNFLLHHVDLSQEIAEVARPRRCPVTLCEVDLIERSVEYRKSQPYVAVRQARNGDRRRAPCPRIVGDPVGHPQHARPEAVGERASFATDHQPHGILVAGQEVHRVVRL